MRPGVLRVWINWGDTCTLFWGDKPPQGVPFVTFSKCIFLNKESNKEHAFSNLQTSWDFSGFGGFSEIIVLKSMYIYIYTYICL